MRSDPVVGISYVRRRSRVPRPVTVVLSVVVLGLVWVGTAASMQAGPAAPVASISTPPPGEVVGSDEPLPPSEEIFATVHGLALYLPHRNPVAVAFHEASLPQALRLEPNGRLVANDSPSKFEAGTDRPGPTYRVLSSRGRGRPATSAVDIVVPEGDVATAPVTGRIVEVRQYPLYQRTNDWRVVIEPEGRRDLQVVLIHLERPRVQVGDRVVAGRTPLAVVRLLSFASHVDYVTERRAPHTHIEVKLSPASELVDPSAPAVAPARIQGR
ncbi:MAG: hypothetical protein ACRD0K_27195 [Egibacteraceae bacterium]